MHTEAIIFHHQTTDEKLNRFGYGEWIEEEDERRFIYRGIGCFILRLQLGHLGGYCRLPDDHPWRKEDKLFFDSLNIHSSVYFFQKGWIGFASESLSDLIPRTLWDMKESESFIFKLEATYRNMDFMMGECAVVVDQILEARIEKNETTT